jgi:hypothetical protein
LTIAKPQSVNLFDTIATGYEAVHRRPQVLLAPLIVNLILWYSPHLPLRSMFTGFNGWATERLGPAPLQESVVNWFERLDLRLAALPLLSSVPVLAPGVDDGSAPTLPTAINHPLGLIGVAIGLNCVALLISSGYLVGLVQGVRGSKSSRGEYLRQVGQTATLIGGALLIVIGVLLVLALPFLALSLLLLMAIPASLLVIVGLWYIAIFWVLIYTTLVPEAAAMSSKGPLHCIYTSVNLVRRNTMATLVLLGIGLLVGSGFGSVFRYLAEAGAFWGPPLACACSAYIGSGLAAARVVFYRERLARWGK